MLMPMFPLGSVLFPGGVLPLQVFEPRYRRLLDDIGQTDNRFGVVLIRRGFEVGGGDERHDVGTIAEIVRSGDATDEVVHITAVGRERIRVVNWSQDDPYPLAEVAVIADPAMPSAAGEAIAAAAAARRRLLALAIEMGAEGQQLDIELPEDRWQAAWTLCTGAPVGAFDRQRLLEMDDVVERMAELERLLMEQARDLERVLLS